MQTAVDSNTKTTNTITNHNDPNCSITQQYHQQISQAQQSEQSHQPHFLMQPTPETETRNILKHHGNANTSSSTDFSVITGTEYDLLHLIDAAEYMDQSVEYVSVAPPTSPQASPSKSVKLKKAVAGGVVMQTNIISTGIQDAHKTNTSSETTSLKTSSNSTSTTSSVIALPVLKHNGNVFKCKEQEQSEKYEDSGANFTHVETTKAVAEEISDSECKCEENIFRAAEDCKHFSDCINKQFLSDQRLPNENTSLTRIASSSSLSISPTISLLSITALSETDTSTLSLSASTTSVTPASAATTPALSTPTSSSSSSSSPLSFSSPLSHLASTVESKIKELSISGLVETELLQLHDMPQYLQFNPYVLKGYRPLTTFKGCLLSLFYWHNETINIISHAIPIVYILAIVPGLMPWENGYGFLSFCHIFGAVAPWCGSFVYHLFMNIERGEIVYNRLLKLDMLGIWVSQSFGALPLLTASTFCFTFIWKWFIIISYCILSFWGLYKALTASSPWQRRLCFGLPFAMRSILTFFRTIGLVGGNRVALEHVYLQDGVSIIGGAIGAMRIPEKWFPGLVDFYLNSHNIMHVVVVVAVYSMFKATMKDLEWMESANCDDFANITTKVLGSNLSTKIDL